MDDDDDDDVDVDEEDDDLTEGEMRLLNLININKIDVKVNFLKASNEMEAYTSNLGQLIDSLFQGSGLLLSIK